MENLFKNFDLSRLQPKLHQPRNHREDLIEQIRTAINKERLGTKYKQLSHMAIKTKVSHLSDFDLSFFTARCAKADSFGRCFFGLLKVDDQHQ